MNDEYESPAHCLLEQWFSSQAWNQICEDAEKDDQDSIDLIEEVNERLRSLIFHLSNHSGNTRIQYELKPKTVIK